MNVAHLYYACLGTVLALVLFVFFVSFAVATWVIG